MFQVSFSELVCILVYVPSFVPASTSGDFGMVCFFFEKKKNCIRWCVYDCGYEVWFFGSFPIPGHSYLDEIETFCARNSQTYVLECAESEKYCWTSKKKFEFFSEFSFFSSNRFYSTLDMLSTPGNLQQVHFTSLWLQKIGLSGKVELFLKKI